MPRNLEFDPKKLDFHGGPTSQALIHAEKAVLNRELHFMLLNTSRDSTKNPAQQAMYASLAARAKEMIVEELNNILRTFDTAVMLAEDNPETYRDVHMRTYAPEVYSTPQG